jgi:ribose transport system permease protein
MGKQETNGSNNSVGGKTSPYGRNFGQAILRQGSALLGFIILVTIATFLSPTFRNPVNMLNILLQVSTIAFVAMGMTFVMISGGIDLSVGAIVALTAEVMALLALNGMSWWFAGAIALALGFAMGAFNGFLIHRLNVIPFIVTLATMQVYRGCALLITNGNYLYNLPPGLEPIGQGHLFGAVPAPPLLVIGVSIIAWFVLSRTKLGRSVYAIGGNEEASRLAGINIGSNKVVIYGICGLFCGIAAVVQTSRLMSTYTGLGVGWELDAIAATVMGGTAFSGGVGGVIGTLIGVLILGVIRNILTLINANPFVQIIVIGLVVLLAVVIDKVRQRVSSQPK